MLAALLCLLDYVTLVAAADSYTTKYIGCFEAGGEEGDAIQGGMSYADNPVNVYSKCESLALSKGYGVFAINSHQYCYTLYDAYKTFANYGTSDTCWASLVDGKYIEQAGEGAMSVYQIVEYEHREYRDMDSSITCDQDDPKREAAIMIVNATFGSTECDYVNVTISVKALCDGVTTCTLDYQKFKDLYCNNPAAKFTVAYGCLFRGWEGDGSGDLGATIFQNIRWILFVLAVSVALPIMWCRRRHLLRRYPILRGGCWQLHTVCPCLQLFPREATGQDHGTPRVIANPAQATFYPPPPATGAYPPSPAVVTHQPVSVNLNTAGPPAYPPSVAPPAYPPPPDTADTPYPPPSGYPPPPTYDAATTGYPDPATTRTSGGWFG